MASARWMPICRYYGRPGGCWYGDRCKFLHEGEPVTKASDQRDFCRFFSFPEKCWFGDNCKFLHADTTYNSYKAEEDEISSKMSSLNMVEKYTYELPVKEEPGLDAYGDQSADSLDEVHYYHYYDEDSSSDEDDEDEEQEEERVVRLKYDSSPDTGARFKSYMEEKKDRSNQDIIDASCSRCGEEFFGEDAFDDLQIHYEEKILKFDYQHLSFLTGHPKFDKPTCCLVCDKFFARSRDLLRHTVDKSKFSAMDKEEHCMILKKGVIQPLCYFDAGVDDYLKLQEELLLSLVNSYTGSDSNSDDGFSFFLGVNFSGDDDDNDDDDDDQYFSNPYGFTDDDCYELLCQGVKPWDDDAPDVLDALNGYGCY